MAKTESKVNPWGSKVAFARKPMDSLPKGRKQTILCVDYIDDELFAVQIQRRVITVRKNSGISYVRVMGNWREVGKLYGGVLYYEMRSKTVKATSFDEFIKGLK
jgi:hypothetical protein